MRFIYGISTSIFLERPLDVFEAILFAYRNNFSVLELICTAPDFKPNRIDPETRKQIREKALDYGLSLQLHAPFYSVNLADFDDDFRNLSLKLILDTIKLAYDIDAKIVTIHPGLCFLPCKLFYDKAIDILVQNIGYLVDIARENSVIISIETRAGNLDIGKPEEIIHIFRKLNFPSELGVTFDVVQANLMGNPVEVYRKLRKLIVNAHIRDAPRGKEDLLAVGEGEIDFPPLIKEFVNNRFFGPLIFEMSTPQRALISRARLEYILMNVTSNRNK